MREEKRLWGSSCQVFVGGVGQGATVAIYYALNTKEKPAGVISVDGYFPKTLYCNFRVLPLEIK